MIIRRLDYNLGVRKHKNVSFRKLCKDFNLDLRDKKTENVI